MRLQTSTYWFSGVHRDNHLVIRMPPGEDELVLAIVDVLAAVGDGDRKRVSLQIKSDLLRSTWGGMRSIAVRGVCRNVQRKR